MLNSSSSGQASLSTRVKLWLESLPIASRTIFALCVSIFVLGAFSGYDDLRSVCLAADRVVWEGQVWRLFTSPLFHVGLLHVAFNMMTFLPAAASLERSLGTIPLVHLILLLVALGNAAYVFISFAAAFGPLRLGIWWVQQCAVGLSGVIFGLIVIDNANSGGTHRSVFGLFTVPAVAYPWALLVACQFLIPGASFLGHLCGLLVGQLYVWGWLTWLLLPLATVRWLESCRAMVPVYRCACFIAVSGPSMSAGGPGPALPTHQSAPSQHSGSILQETSRLIQAQWARLLGNTSGVTTSPPPATRIETSDLSGIFGVGAAGQSPTSARPWNYGQPRTIDSSAGTAPLQLQQQHNSSGGGRSRQLDPEAGGAMEALAARASAAAAAEARASGLTAVTIVTTGRSGSEPSLSVHPHLRTAGRPSPAAQAAELRAYGIGSRPSALHMSQDPSSTASDGPAGSDGRKSSGSSSSSAELLARRQRSYLGSTPERDVARLIEMGFDPDTASAALEAAHGDVNLAADTLSS